jgi:uncharacterized protein YkwD
MKKILFSLILIMGLHPYSFASTSIDEKNKTIILDKINEYRIQHGLTALTMNPAISEQAKEHSQEMANNTMPFSHDGFDKRANQLQKQFKNFRAMAENIAYTDEDVKTVVELWLKSRGHRENIEGNYNLTGLGMAYNKNGRVFITQIFVRAQE